MSSVTPTRNSWPTRCASVSRPNTWAAQDTVGEGDAGDEGAVLGGLVTADGWSDEADGVAGAAGELQPAVTASAAPTATAHVTSVRARGRARSQCTARL
jgi:hypothetical protein